MARWRKEDAIQLLPANGRHAWHEIVAAPGRAEQVVMAGLPARAALCELVRDGGDRLPKYNRRAKKTLVFRWRDHSTIGGWLDGVSESKVPAGVTRFIWLRWESA